MIRSALSLSVSMSPSLSTTCFPLPCGCLPTRMNDLSCGSLLVPSVLGLWRKSQHWYNGQVPLQAPSCQGLNHWKHILSSLPQSPDSCSRELPSIFLDVLTPSNTIIGECPPHPGVWECVGTVKPFTPLPYSFSLALPEFSAFWPSGSQNPGTRY